MFPKLSWWLPGFDSWVWRRKWQPAPVSLSGACDGQRSLAGYGPRGRRESDTTERLSQHAPGFGVSLGVKSAFRRNFRFLRNKTDSWRLGRGRGWRLPASGDQRGAGWKPRREAEGNRGKPTEAEGSRRKPREADESRWKPTEADFLSRMYVFVFPYNQIYISYTDWGHTKHYIESFKN